MTTLPFVSIIVPVHNGEKTLARCLESILAQTYESFEVIVVDNRSTDRTSVIIHDFLHRSSRLWTLVEWEVGRGAARRAGERVAHGDLVLMTDSDCVVPDHWIEMMISPIITEGFDLVQGLEDSIGKDFWSLCYQRYSDRKWEHFDGEFFPGYIDTKNLAIRKSLLHKVGYSSSHFRSGEDTDLSIRLYLTHAKLRPLRECRVFHHHPSTCLEVIRKHMQRGFWSYVLNQEIGTTRSLIKFKEASAQTLSSFFKLKELILTFIKEGRGFALYLLVSGLAWRLGILGAFFTYRSGKKGFTSR